MRGTAFAAALLLTTPVVEVAAAPTVLCTDPTTGRERSVPIRKIRLDVTKMRRELRRRGLHILDLPAEAHVQHRLLVKDEAERAWCRVRDEVTALDRMLAAATVDSAFVAERLGRIERWVEASPLAGESRTRAAGLVTQARTDLGAGRFVKANTELGSALALLLDSNDPWYLPERMPAASVAESTAVTGTEPAIDDAEVVSGCPELAKTRGVQQRDYEMIRGRLERAFDERRLRVVDLKAGPDLAASLRTAVGRGAWDDAASAACVLLARARIAEIDLGVVMARFRAVNRLQDTHPLEGGDKERFSQLVRSASDDIANRAFPAAFATLEELLVLMGDPVQPSATLP